MIVTSVLASPIFFLLIVQY
uniref:Uncharacterized protein n=1 Tax=Arundo donax TaxID=35708 RepID=A0A0A8YAY4_ARUDO